MNWDQPLTWDIFPNHSLKPTGNWGGEAPFVTATKEKLGVKGKGREVIGADGSHELRESPAPYRGILRHVNECLRLENTYVGDDNS